MKRIISSLLCSGIVLGFAAVTLKAEDKSESDRLGPPVRHVNESAKKAGTGPALHAISVETGVSREELEAMHKRYSDANVAGVFMACVIADETKKAPEDVLKRHRDGKSWPEIAHENHVPVDKIIDRLDRLDRHIARPEGERDDRVKRRKN